jgi:predicted negative regulator of RcsB-dependent stress response
MIQQAGAAEPDNVAYLDSLGWVLYRLGRFEEALVPLEQAAAHGADGVILDHLGDVYLQAGQPARAVEAWRKAAAKLENDSDNERAAAIRTKIRQYTAHNGTD